MSYNESLNPNSNYPLMTQSQWDSSPMAQEDYPERDFDVTISCSLSRDARVTSDDYDGGEYDEDGYWCAGDLNNPYEAYSESYKSISEIIDFAKECAEYFLANKNYKVRPKYTLKKFIDSCQGWTIDEENVEQI